MRYYYYGGKASNASLEEQQNGRREMSDREQVSYEKGYDRSVHRLPSDRDLIIEADTVYEIDRQCMRKRNFPN